MAGRRGNHEKRHTGRPTRAKRPREATLPVPRRFEDDGISVAAGPSGETAVPPIAGLTPGAGLVGVPPVWAALPWCWPLIWWAQATSITAGMWTSALPVAPLQPPTRPANLS